MQISNVTFTVTEKKYSHGQQIHGALMTEKEPVSAQSQ